MFSYFCGMMWFRKSIPNFITILNLLCGSAAVIFIFKDQTAIAALLIIWAAVFDFFDGLAARALGAYSDVGKELDSLSDVISFGLAPGMLVYHFLEKSLPADYQVLAFSGLLIPAFSALRLARFNVMQAHSSDFSGLPVPANALFFISLPLLELVAKEGSYIGLAQFVLNPWFIIASTIFFSSLLLSPVRLMSLKFKNLRFKENAERFIFILTALFLFSTFHLVSTVFIIPAYLIISLISNIINPN